MFSSSSRYSNIEDAQMELKVKRQFKRKLDNGEGKDKETVTVNYKKRRFIPIEQNIQVTNEIFVRDGDRLDNLTAKYLGNPELFWQICDINENVMHPLDLTDKPGRRIKIGYYTFGQ